MLKLLTPEGLSLMLRKIKTVFATKTEVNAVSESLANQSTQMEETCVHKTGNETIAGTKTFSSTISGSINGLAAKATTDANGRSISTGYMWRGSYERIEGTSTTHKDLNSYVDAGFYNIKTAYVDNCPSGIGIDAVMLVYPWNKSGYLTQEVTESAASTDTRRWIRKLDSSTWSAWKEVAFTASPALTGTPTSPTAALGTNSTQLATTAFVYQNAARILNVDTTIYVAQAKAGTGDGSSVANAMTTDDMWKYLASVRMIPAAGAKDNSRTLTIKFVPNGTTSYGNITFDANKLPGVRNLVIDTSSTTASSTSNYTTNCPTFGNIYVLGNPLHVTMKNIYATGLIQAEWGGRIILNTFIGAQRFIATLYGRMELGNGIYAIKNAGTDYLAKGTEYGQMLMVSKTCNFHFMEQCYFTGGIYLSDTGGRIYVRHDYIKLTGTKPIVTLNASGTKTGTCSTAAGTAAKAVTLESGQTFTLATNAVAYVTFSNTNTAANPTLNINGTGAKSIYFSNAAIPAAYINKHIQYKFTYNGTQYVCNNTFNRVEVAGVHSYFSRNGAAATTYNSSTFNWSGYSTSFGSGANVAGVIQGTATAASKVGTNLVLKIKTGTTENTNLYTYNGSAAKTLDIKQGSNVTLTAAANALTIAATTSSDARMKTPPQEISDEALDAWGQLRWNQFKYKKDVAEFGDDAKTHFGLIAQEVNAKMDPSTYAFTESVPNDDEATMEEMPEYWTMNYIEALTMEAAWQRRENGRLQSQIDELKAEVAAMKKGE